MNSVKKILLGGAAIAALSGTAALADYTATSEGNTAQPGTTALLRFDSAVDADPTDVSDGTVVIDEFTSPPAAAAVDQLTVGNNITFTLNTGTFAILPTVNITNNANNSSFVLIGGGVGQSTLTYRVEGASIDMSAGGNASTVTMTNIRLQANSYSNGSGSSITLAVSDTGGELSQLPASGVFPSDQDRIETLFTFSPLLNFTPADENPGNAVQDFSEFTIASGGNQYDENEDGTAGPNSLIGSLAVANGSGTYAGGTLDATLTGPFSGIGSVVPVAIPADCPEVGAVTPLAGETPEVPSGNSVSFTDIPLGAPGTVLFCASADLNPFSLLSPGTFAVSAASADTTTAGSVSAPSGGNMNVQTVTDGQVGVISYFTGAGGGYNPYLWAAADDAATPVIVAVQPDSGGNLIGGTIGQLGANTGRLFSAAQVSAPLPMNPFTNEADRGVLHVYMGGTDPKMTPLMLNPGNVVTEFGQDFSASPTHGGDATGYDFIDGGGFNAGPAQNP